MTAITRVLQKNHSCTFLVHRGILTQFFHLSLWWKADSDLSSLLCSMETVK